MKKILGYLGYDSELVYYNRILYIMIFSSILVASMYLLVYIVFIPFMPAIIVHVIYISFSFSLYIALKHKYYNFVKVAMIMAHLIQLTLAVFLWFPVETGYNLYYFMVPMVTFLIMIYEVRWQLVFSVGSSILATFLYFISKLLIMDHYIYETTVNMNRFLGSSGILCIFLPMTYIFTRFSADIFNSHKELHRLATTDSLTRTANRKVLFEHGEASILSACEDNRHFSLMIMDIDYFKNINDQYGHPVGDEVLKQLAELVHENIRKDDVFSRFGGEEFAIVLEGVDIKRAKIISNDLLELIRKNKFVIDTLELQITVSIGVIEYIQDYAEFKQMMKAADEALYTAKDQGRNQVVAS